MSSTPKHHDSSRATDSERRATLLKLTALAFLGLGILIVVVFDPMHWNFFRGLSHAKGMEQAQIAREIASGNGYSTKMIRPLAIAQMKAQLAKEGKGDDRQELRERLTKDTYHAPLWSTTLAPILKAAQNHWTFKAPPPIYLLDKLVAVFSILLLYAAVIVNFFTLRRLFDTRLAMIASGIQLVTYPFWQYAMSGLPHMLMLLLFSGIGWALVRAIDAKEENKPDLKWITLIGVLSGLLVLTHYLTFWMVIGLLAFCALYFPNRWRNVAIIAGIIALMVAPWLIRNYQLTGNPLGLAGHSVFHAVINTEEAVMRTLDKNALSFHYSQFRGKLQSGISDQISGAPGHLGGWIAPLFFVALLYPFRRPVVRNLRWALLLMWLPAIFGMALFAGSDVGTNLSATNLQLLFIPLFVGFGAALLLTLWSGLNLRIPMLRSGFITLLIVISGLPFINALLNKTIPYWWPPYAPPYVAFLANWTTEDECIISDMPWAVAWYADRYSLWLPTHRAPMFDLLDYNRIDRPFCGLFLTPITSSAPFLSSIVRGAYEDWAPFILRQPNRPHIPFTKPLPLGPRAEYILYSDFERWSPDEAEKLKKMQEASENEERKKNPQQPKSTPAQSSEETAE